MSLRFKLVILFLVASFLPFAVVGALLYLDNPQVLDKLIYLGGLLIIFVVVLGLMLSQIIIEPINNLIRATRAVRGKNLAARVPVTTKDETGELTEAFNQMMDEVERTDKTKTEFVSLASHHLRTPLTTIRWHLETVISEADKLSEEDRRYLQEASEGANRMVELVNTLLDVTRLEMGTFALNPEAVDVPECVADVLKDLEKKMNQKSIKIKSDIQLTNNVINSNSKMLRLIMQNLLVNALDYTPDKGSVELKITEEDHNLLITVTDTGYGIPKADQAQVFNKLYRASNVKTKVGEGLGLGLYTVRIMTEQAKGKVWFESQEDHGTTFYVKLPLSHERIEHSKDTPKKNLIRKGQQNG